MKNKIKNFFMTLIIISVFIGLLPTTAMATDDVVVDPIPEIRSMNASVYSTSSKRELVSYTSHMKVRSASFTKMMTAVVAVKNAELTVNQVPNESEFVKIGKDLSYLPDGYNGIGLKEGDVISLTNLIRAMIVYDADDAALVIAIYIGRKKLGGTPDPRYTYDRDAFDHFVTLMGDEARLMGLSETYFAEPAGLEFTVKDSPFPTKINSHSTTFDTAKIAERFLSNVFLRETAGMKSVVNPVSLNDEVNGMQKTLLKNNNKLLDPESEYYYEHCTGVIASNDNVDGVYIAAHANYRDIDIIVSVIGEDEDSAYRDVIDLFNYVFSNYVMHTFIEEGQVIAEYYVKNAMDPSNEHLIVVADAAGRYLSRVDELSFFGSEVRISKEFFAPTAEDINDVYICPVAEIKKGTVIGTIDVYYNTLYIGTSVLYAGNTIRMHSDLPMMKEKKWYNNIPVNKIILIVIVFALIISIIVFSLSIISKVRRQKAVKRRYAASKSRRGSAKYTKRKK